MIVSDNGTGLISKVILGRRSRVAWHYIAPGDPVQNAIVACRLQQPDALTLAARLDAASHLCDGSAQRTATTTAHQGTIDQPQLQFRLYKKGAAALGAAILALFGGRVRLATMNSPRDRWTSFQRAALGETGCSWSKCRTLVTSRSLGGWPAARGSALSTKLLLP
jgi:hypothetical protein